TLIKIDINDSPRIRGKSIIVVLGRYLLTCLADCITEKSNTLIILLSLFQITIMLIAKIIS
ncbi:hypothetical protein DMP16_10470, partial [Sulfolobus sp. B1]|uniref:hypothetical protein n=1 Tax=Sulfolobus sp. B1 TaxID=2200888 RepID=UPI00163D7DA8